VLAVEKRQQRSRGQASVVERRRHSASSGAASLVVMGVWTATIAHTVKATLGYDFDKRIISTVIIDLLDMKGPTAKFRCRAAICRRRIAAVLPPKINYPDDVVWRAAGSTGCRQTRRSMRS
jgi:hypothetical protein